MKDRVIYGALLMAGMLLCVLLSPVTRVVFFAAAGILCMYEYCARLQESGIHCAFWALSLFLISAAVLALLGAETELWCAAFAIFVFLSMSSGIFDAKISGRGAVYTAGDLHIPVYSLPGSSAFQARSLAESADLGLPFRLGLRQRRHVWREALRKA